MVPKKDITSDALHNKNAYNFLKQLNLPNSSLAGLPELEMIRSKSQDYDEHYAYGNLYNRFMANLEAKVAAGYLAELDYDDFFISLYKNDNKNLEETFAVIEPTALDKSAADAPLEKTLKKKLRDKGSVLNRNTPAKAGSTKGRFFDMVYPFYKPSHQTSLATVRQYTYNQDNKAPQELRFGTQGQTHAYLSRVSPLFKRFLQAQQRKNPNKIITHIYFNNLAKDRNPWSFEGRFEMGLTKALHGLKEPNIAVITLPADKGLMRVHDIADTEPHLNKKQIQKTFLEIALESHAVRQKIKDFHISPALRGVLFENNNEKTVLSGLLDKSFTQLGLKDAKVLSPAQRQAVWVHFLKFELPQYIIEKMRPETYNFSCKDAIDRGGIASAYYNLWRSFATQQPMTRQEFEKALHAAPAMVKGRGMNHHIKIIWNTIDQYITNHPDLPEAQQWLIDWRDANCPHERAADLFMRRLEQCRSDLSNTSNNLHAQGVELLQILEKRFQGSHPKNHALFLTVLLSTHNLCMHQHPSQDKLDEYKATIEKIPRLYRPIADCMQKIANSLRAMLSFNHREKTYPFTPLKSDDNTKGEKNDHQFKM